MKPQAALVLFFATASVAVAADPLPFGSWWFQEIENGTFRIGTERLREETDTNSYLYLECVPRESSFALVGLYLFEQSHPEQIHIWNENSAIYSFPVTWSDEKVAIDLVDERARPIRNLLFSTKEFISIGGAYPTATFRAEHLHAALGYLLGFCPQSTAG
jgi:hypothetical protein